MIKDKINFEFRDEFKREVIAKKIAKLLDSNVDISPFVIDGNWGTGKTEFCYKLINMINADEGNSVKTVYIDAFKADHADNALLTVLSAVLKVIPDKKSKDDFKKKAIMVARYGLKTVAKASVAHVLKQDTGSVLDGYDKEIKGAADKVINASVEAVLNDHVDANKNLQALQKVLRGITDETEIIIFVDELDRCRPDFAVSMIETIKHIFDIPDLKFVLVTNLTQLKASINHCYGKTIDSQSYLDKFLKFSIMLPSELNGGYEGKENVSVKHFFNLVNKENTLKNISLAHPEIKQFINSLVRVNHTSLREVETFVRHLNIYQELAADPLSNKNYLGHKLLVLTGIALFSFKPSIANDIVNDELDALKLGMFLGYEKILSDKLKRPENNEIIAVILAKESQYNKGLFKSEDPVIEDNFERCFNLFFEGQFGFFRDDRKLDIVKNVIKVLNLI